MPDIIQKLPPKPITESVEKAPAPIAKQKCTSFKLVPQCEDVLEETSQPVAVSKLKTKDVPLKELFKVPGDSSPPQKKEVL